MKRRRYAWGQRGGQGSPWVLLQELLKAMGGLYERSDVIHSCF